MLINFRVSNFTSYNAPTVFTMESGKARGKREHLHIAPSAKTLKFSAIYGANAAGKSNLVSAMDFARDLILGAEDVRLPLSYNRVVPENKDLPSLFEFEILIGNTRYTYGFEIILSRHQFQSEWLWNTTKMKKVIFERHMSSFEESSLSIKVPSDLQSRFDTYWQDILADTETLFLNDINNKKADLYSRENAPTFLQEIYRWFKYKLCIIHPNQHQISLLPDFISENWDNIASYLADFDIDITAGNFTDVPEEQFFQQLPDKVRSNLRKQLVSLITQFYRDSDGQIKDRVIPLGSDLYSFRLEDSEDSADPKLIIRILKLEHRSKLQMALSEESDGTRRVLELIKILLIDNMTFVIDEIDRSMHPKLTLTFIDSFLRKIAERNAQLIITTHEPRLLNLQNLRRDEVWFVDKQDGVSEFSRLDSFESKGSTAFRGDIKIETAYMNGRFRGVPKTRSVE